MAGRGGGNYWGSKRVPVSSVCACVCVSKCIPAFRPQTVSTSKWSGIVALKAGMSTCHTWQFCRLGSRGRLGAWVQLLGGPVLHVCILTSGLLCSQRGEQGGRIVAVWVCLHAMCVCLVAACGVYVLYVYVCFLSACMPSLNICSASLQVVSGVLELLWHHPFWASRYSDFLLSLLCCSAFHLHSVHQ